MKSSLGPLPDGGRIVIIGGGPGGVACGLALQRLAAELNRRLQITILEGKQFAGEHHYNQCVGVLSHPLPSLLEAELKVPFPYNLSRGEIQAYVLHTAAEEIKVASQEQDSIIMRRVQFDAYMLEQAKQNGIAIISARAVDIEFHAEKVVVYTESAPLECDIVVGAFGMDEGSAAFFSRQTNYKPPLALSSVVTKYHPDPESVEAFGSNIHAFLLPQPGIEFGAITPKGNHLTINIAGLSVDTELMQVFLDHPTVRAQLPAISQAVEYNPADLRFFKGRFPRSLAQKYYGDRYVMIGDAAGLVRAFKGKGVTSAVLTGIRAAKTILEKGISKHAFHSHFRTANRDITRDLPYGRAMRLLTIYMARFRLLDPILRAARQDANLSAALFDAISAHAPYSQVFNKALKPRSIWAIIRALL
ncbi:MAG: hypothetical protein FVQ83_08880 [Chloroflexi bacterium]|nr:hypothetical protein [Chloroflexota bacterium]